MIRNVTFGGLYFVHFQTQAQAKEGKQKLQNFVTENGLTRLVAIEQCQDSDKVIGVATNAELPRLHYELFRQVSPNLAEQYRQKTIVNLYA